MFSRFPSGAAKYGHPGFVCLVSSCILPMCVEILFSLFISKRLSQYPHSHEFASLSVCSFIRLFCRSEIVKG